MDEIAVFLKNEIIIRGDPITGTKNWEIRRVPMIPEMRKLLERLKAERGETEFLDNPVLKVRKFNRSLKNACKKLGLFHLTHHDLRHLFATRCIGVWRGHPDRREVVGHKDGGVLAMQTYGHFAGWTFGEHGAESHLWRSRNPGCCDTAQTKPASHRCLGKFQQNSGSSKSGVFLSMVGVQQSNRGFLGTGQ